MRFILWYFILDNPASSTNVLQKLCKSMVCGAFSFPAGILQAQPVNPLKASHGMNGFIL